MDAALPRFGQVLAPPGWRSVELISDLHLQASEPATFEAWRSYMRDTAADAVFILGDLFEVWVGDDAAAQPGFAADCAAVLQATSAARPVFFLHGNRDFLVGSAFLQSCGVTLLEDPSVLDFAGRRWLLSHGDALCLADTDYLRFRQQVRQAGWQRDFLAKPLAERQAIGRAMREQSEARKQPDSGWADVDSGAALAWLAAAGADVLVHGHTHRPARHALDAVRERIVLTDWDASAVPPRLQALRLDSAGAQRIPLA
ncbi:UDP-2,3-diacylglucosamine diphosphatase [uncultured Ramlibacter sp.]|uniref:UDP-2,3-diacylglucosamine diphosphatase n=1 Tax=uncultured Ramlibacter sp. TaxID=260755 RepID=UPI00263691C2|nr:UDP-2,3-diacylglucosamine diphosphatase [uncultured Ramlibacter sp.]